MIISFASSKGGVGKSTSCAAIAAKLADEGAKVLVFDLDQIHTVARWGQKFEHPNLTVEDVSRDGFTARFRDVVKQGRYDHVLIDLAGTREATVLKAMARSDLVVIPAQASEPDLREALVVISDIKDVEEAKAGTIAYRLLLTKVYPLRTRVTEFAFDEIERHGIARFETTFVERAAYKEMLLNGVPPHVAQPSSGAGAEVCALVEEIKQLGTAGRRKTARAALKKKVGA